MFFSVSRVVDEAFWVWIIEIMCVCISVYMYKYTGCFRRNNTYFRRW